MNTSKYANTYIWQALSIVSRFASIFAIVPLLAKDASVYGVYALCMSLSIYLSYADLGFLSAAQKYAAESFSKRDLDAELKYVGFAFCVLIVVGILFSSVLVGISFFPKVLLGQGTSQQYDIASKLTLILAASVPITIVQRTLLTAFEIRLETYISNKVMTASSLLTLLGGFYFLGEEYDVVGYSAYTQVVALCAAVTCYWLAVKRYGYNPSRIANHLRFDRGVYAKIKELSHTGMLLMLFWVLFYELDQIAIAHFFGASGVAVYAIAASISSYLRIGLGSIYSPFLARANQYIGSDDAPGLRAMIDRVMLVFTSPVLFLCIIIACFANPFVISWVGGGYEESVYLVQLLALQFALSVVSYPVGVILVAKVETKKLRNVAVIQPIAFWLLVLGLMQTQGVAAFIEARVAVLVATFAYYLTILRAFFETQLRELLRRYFLSSALSGAMLCMACIYISSLLPIHKSKITLLVVLACGGVLICAAMLMQYSTRREYRQVLKDIFPSIGNRKAVNG